MNDLSRLSIEELTEKIKSFILFEKSASALIYLAELARRLQEANERIEQLEAENKDLADSNHALSMRLLDDCSTIGKLEAQLQRKTRQARIFYKMYKIQLDAIEFPPTLRETAKRLVLASAKKQLKEEEKL